VASLLPGWLRSVASVVVYFVPPTFSVMMVDGSLSGRICPRVGVSEPAGGARPRLSGVDIGLAIPRRADPRCLFFWGGEWLAPVMEVYYYVHYG
jgi:hypothetical protein